MAAAHGRRAVRGDAGAAFPKVKRVRRRNGWRKRDPSKPLDVREDDLQAMAEQYLDARGLQWLHIPPSALRACAVGSATSIGQKREIADYLKGVPDLLIFGPAVEGVEWVRALCVELKVGGNKMSGGQRRWAAGTRVHECRDIEAFVAMVERFAKGGV